MDGHVDAVSCMAKNPNHLKGIFSGSMDGGKYVSSFFPLFFPYMPGVSRVIGCLYSCLWHLIDALPGAGLWNYLFLELQ